LPSGIDWQSLADPGITTVFYMGGRTAPEIRLRLLDAGMAANTPVVVMSAITRTNERHWLGVLDRLDVAMGGIGVDEPVLIGIGAVFSSIVQSDSVDRTSHVNDRVSVLRQAIC
jgi:uroporphyrin-III C-methyltransferase/precorrin-2 dehydrogenase/sirohydrochlorin ferrochelatase